MTIGKRHAIFWTAMLGAILLCLYLLRGMILPFAAALVLAYILDPVADRLERLGMSRLFASLTILTIWLVLFIVALVVVIPFLTGQLIGLVQAIPDYVARLQVIITHQYREWLQPTLGEKVLADIQRMLSDFVPQATSWALSVLNSVVTGGQAIIAVLALLFITPIVAFYILVDWDKLVAQVDALVPVEHRETVRSLARDIDRTLTAFFRGQGTVCLILAAFYGIALWLVGLNYGVSIGVTTGLLSFIPYVGAVSGFVLAATVAVVQFFPNWSSILLVLAVFGIGQILEGYILSPKLVGESVGLHPVWVMFALLAAGYLFGFIGVLVAVPVAAAIGVLLRFIVGRYLASDIYGAEKPPPGSAQ